MKVQQGDGYELVPDHGDQFTFASLVLENKKVLDSIHSPSAGKFPGCETHKPVIKPLYAETKRKEKRITGGFV